MQHGSAPSGAPAHFDHRLRPWGGELDRIAQHTRQNLAQLGGIHPHIRKIIGNTPLQHALWMLGLQGLAKLLHHGADLHRSHVQRHRAQARILHQAIHQHPHVPRRAGDGGQMGLGLGVELRPCVFLHDFRKRQDVAQISPQIVGYGVGEVLQFGARRLQLRLQSGDFGEMRLGRINHPISPPITRVVSYRAATSWQCSPACHGPH